MVVMGGRRESPSAQAPLRAGHRPKVAGVRRRCRTSGPALSGLWSGRLGQRFFLAIERQMIGELGHHDVGLLARRRYALRHRRRTPVFIGAQPFGSCEVCISPAITHPTSIPDHFVRVAPKLFHLQGFSRIRSKNLKIVTKGRTEVPTDFLILQPFGVQKSGRLPKIRLWLFLIHCFSLNSTFSPRISHITGAPLPQPTAVFSSSTGSTGCLGATSSHGHPNSR